MAKSLGIIFILVFLSFAQLLFAQSDNDAEILRPVIEYSSGDLRDPFSNQFLLSKERKEQSNQVLLENVVEQQPMPKLENFNVQGVIWGGNFPQAIINNRVLKVGDVIDGAEIKSIEEKEIILNFAGILANLPTPGNAPALSKGNKEEK